MLCSCISSEENLTGRLVKYYWPGTLAYSPGPILRTVQQGQINVVLAALVVVDLLLLPRQFRGVLIGLAAGIKLVPAAFVICLVAQRDWRSIIRVAVTGLATIAVSYLVNPASTRQYWLKLLFSTERWEVGVIPITSLSLESSRESSMMTHLNPLATLPLQPRPLARPLT